MKNKELTSVELNRILFCTDFSENADYAFKFATDAAMRRPGCELYMLHVIPESESQFWKTYIYEVDDVDNKAKKDIDEKIKAAYIDNLPDGIDLKIHCVVGKDSETILDFAKENNIDLIVMGRHGHSSFQKALFGNVTEKVVRKADCAVLVIPMSFQQSHNSL